MNNTLVEYMESEAPPNEAALYRLYIIEQKYQDAMDQIARAHDLLDDAGVPAFDEDIGNRVAYAAGMVAARKAMYQPENGQEPANLYIECEACDAGHENGPDHHRNCPAWAPF